MFKSGNMRFASPINRSARAKFGGASTDASSAVPAILNPEDKFETPNL
jgi:hypothetical protein